MRIYFAGANTRVLLEAVKGKRVLETFADRRPVIDEYRHTWEGTLLDSGAFSAYNSGKVINLQDYIDYCLIYKKYYEGIVVLDDIAGNVDLTKRNLTMMIENSIPTIPVYHQGEPVSVLQEYCADFDYIGLGFKRPIQDAKRYLDECFSHIPETTKVHGFAMTNYMAYYPFYSVDSTSWMLNCRRLWEVKGAQGKALKCLTLAELLEIEIKKYERLPKMERRPRSEALKISSQERLFAGFEKEFGLFLDEEKEN